MCMKLGAVQAVPPKMCPVQILVLSLSLLFAFKSISCFHQQYIMFGFEKHNRINRCCNSWWFLISSWTGACHAGFLRFWLSLYLEKHDFVTVQCSLYHFQQKAPSFSTFGAFLAKFSKVHPILKIKWIVCVTKTHSSIYQKWWKGTSSHDAYSYTIT